MNIESLSLTDIFGSSKIIQLFPPAGATPPAVVAPAPKTNSEGGKAGSLTFGRVRVELTESPDGKKPYLKAWRGKAYRPFANYIFKTFERRAEYLAELQASEMAALAAMKARAEKKKATAAKPNPFKVGDILYNSWGWEQTNVDFYQVTGVTRKGVYLRPINSQMHSNPGGSPMSGKVTALANEFTDDKPAQFKRLVPYDGNQIIVPTHGCMTLWDGQPKYCSWYA